MKKMKNEIMLRIRNAEVFDRLQEMYQKTKFRSINEFLNYLLEEAAFRSINTEEINNSLDTIETFTKGIWDKVQNIDTNIERQYRS